MAAGHQVRISIVVATACCASLIVAPSAGAATPDTVYDPVRIEAPEPQRDGRFGERSALAGDIDGDGVGDFFMSAFQQDVGSAPLAGRVYLISGRTRAVIRTFTSPEPQRQSRFGFTVSSPGDLNGDGKRDVVVGADVHDDYRGESSPGVTDTGACGTLEPNGCYENTGQAWAFDGATGGLLYELANPQPQSNPELPFSKIFGFGIGISSAGDMDGDGINEVLVGAMSNDVPRGCGGQAVVSTRPPVVPPAPPACQRDQGQGFVFNGRTGTLIRTYNLPDPRPDSCSNTDPPGPGIGTCGVLGFTAQGVGDVNGDGAVDHLLDAGTYGPNKDGRIYVFSGRTGGVLLRIDNPSPTSAGGTTRIFGLQTVSPGAPGDVNKDGFDDVYGNGFISAGPTGSSGEGRAWIFSGRDGSILYNLFDPSPDGPGGFAFAGTMTDYDLDGVEDEFMAGQNGSGNVFGGGATIFGVPASFGPAAVAPALKDFQPPVSDRQPSGPPPANGLRFGRTVESPGDLNSDGQPDYVIGAPQTDVGDNPDQGRVYVYLSNVPVTPPAPGAGPPAVPGAPVSPALPAVKATAKLEVARSRVLRSARRLDVLAPITKLASGRVRVEFFAAGRRTRFTAPIDSAKGQIRFSRRIPAAQANLGTGILTLTYLGDADTRPQTVRLRAASQRADLNLARPTIANGRLRANGTVSSAARGVVRVQIEYVADNATKTLEFNARINKGRWRLDQKLSPAVQAAIARRQGTVHSYTLFTGYFPKRIRGEMESFQILGAR